MPEYTYFDLMEDIKRLPPEEQQYDNETNELGKFLTIHYN